MSLEWLKSFLPGGGGGGGMNIAQFGTTVADPSAWSPQGIISPTMAAAPGVSQLGYTAPGTAGAGSWQTGYTTPDTGSYASSALGGSAAGGSGLGNWLSNGQNLGVAIQGFGTLANAYLGFQQLKNAKQNLAFQKDAFNTNLINSTQNYNTSLEDRIRGRTSAYEGKENDVQAYLAKHSLKNKK